MQTLMIEVNQPPAAAQAEMLSLESEINAYPQLLLEGLQSWKRLSLSKPQQFSQSVLQEQPAVIVFVGPPAIAQAWCELSESYFPKLFALAHPPADSEQIMQTIILRTGELRRRRLAGRPSRQPEVQACDPEQLFAALFPAEKRQQSRQLALQLIERYQLEPLLPALNSESFERGLRLLALLEAAFKDLALPLGLQALDLGCHLWSYAPFLKAFYLSGSETVQLNGLELDPWYLQGDGLTRDDWARYHAALTGARYQIGSLEHLSLPPQNVISWLLPLILPENALRWGIPRQAHDPLQSLKQLQALLQPQGLLLIYNGVEAEFQATVSLLQQLDWQPLKQEAYRCPLKQGTQGYLTVLQRPLNPK